MRLFRTILYKIFSKIVCIYEYFYYRFIYSRPSSIRNYTSKRYLLFEAKSLENASSIYRNLFPDKVEMKIREADSICRHYFDLLGSGKVNLSANTLPLEHAVVSATPHQSTPIKYKPIDWHSDFKSGYCWNPKKASCYSPIGHREGIDIKVPWELSRFQHLVVLGQAYVLTGDKKYSQEFANQINDWISNNPVGIGVNWKCTMDVAIRAVNWLVAMEFFAEKDLFSEEMLKNFYVSIYEHGKFIRGHLDNSSQWTTNHYLANVAGLFFIAAYCPFFEESKEWQEFSLIEISKEIEKQIYQDGCSYEASTSYHRLVLEMFFYSELLAVRKGIKLTEKYKETVKKMFEFSLYAIKPNGNIPQIGDNDSGRYIQFSKRPALDHKYLLSLAAIYYEDSNFKLNQSTMDEEAFWVFGKSAKETWDKLPYREVPLKSRSFPNAGWYIIRDNNDFCFISCSPPRRTELNGHSHNDRLSFELTLDGQDIIIDPGTYVYTPYPKERNKFRSTGYHNTIKFEGYEQNELSDKYLFKIPDRVVINNVQLVEDDEVISFQGEIGYAGIRHKRIISFHKKKKSFQLIDSFSGTNPVKGKLLFYLSPDVTFDDNRILMKKTRERIASIKVEGLRLERGVNDYSPEYGVKIEAEHLVATIEEIRGGQKLVTLITKE